MNIAEIKAMGKGLNSPSRRAMRGPPRKDPATATIAAASVSGAGNFLAAKEQAEARKKAAKLRNEPFRQKEPFLENLFLQGQAASQQAQARTQAADPFQAPDATEQSINQRQQLGSELASENFGQGVQEFGQSLLRGDFLDPNNPALQRQISAVTQPVMENFREQTLPSISNQAVEAGQFGSSRQGVIEANALDDVNENITNEVGRIIGKERERQFRAPEILSKAAQLQLTPASILESAGQAELDVASQLQSLEEQRRQNIVADEFAGLRTQAQLLGTGPNQISAPQPGPSPVQSAISGAAGGASTAAGVIKALRQSRGNQNQAA